MNKKNEALISDIYIIIASIVWGLAFVAQRVSIDHIGAFWFNAIRFTLGSLTIIPLYLLTRKKQAAEYEPLSKTVVPALFAGLLLFLGSSMQQVSLYFTTAGKAGFITGLYVVLVPLFQLIRSRSFQLNVIIAALLSSGGLYLLSVGDNFAINRGDFIVFISAFVWAAHILFIGHISGKHNPIAISTIQFAVCALLSAITAASLEEISLQIISSALIPILYGGICSVGIGFTLQVVGQKHAPPQHAVIILSMEAVFAALGAYLIIGEVIPLKGIWGCSLMFLGMIIAQLGKILGKKSFFS